jgi:hypothetical protein
VRFSIARIVMIFYIIKSPQVADFGVKINFFIKHIGVHIGPQSSLRNFFEFGHIKFFWGGF